MFFFFFFFFFYYRMRGGHTICKQRNCLICKHKLGHSYAHEQKREKRRCIMLITTKLILIVSGKKRKWQIKFTPHQLPNWLCYFKIKILQSHQVLAISMQTIHIKLYSISTNLVNPASFVLNSLKSFDGPSALR